MAFTRALYYPTIDITNDEWLKTAVLFWDEINTIVENPRQIAPLPPEQSDPLVPMKLTPQFQSKLPP